MRGAAYLTNTRAHELFEEPDAFESIEDIFQAMRERPQETKIFRFEQKQRPTGWIDEKHGKFQFLRHILPLLHVLEIAGKWPKSGAVLYATRFPSANRTNTNK